MSTIAAEIKLVKEKERIIFNKGAN